MMMMLQGQGFAGLRVLMQQQQGRAAGQQRGLVGPSAVLNPGERGCRTLEQLEI
jgi:hypothetical protein